MSELIPASEARKIFLPQPMVHQIPVLASDARFKWICCGRRWGKSVDELIMITTGHGPTLPDGRPLFLGAIHGEPMAWLSKNKPTSLEHWGWLKEALEPITTRKLEAERKLEIIGGGSVRVLSADEPNSLRGPGYRGVVNDEAAFHDEKAWVVLRPTISEKRSGDGRPNWYTAASSPNGHNWFYQRWKAAKDGRKGHAFFHGITADNPLVPKEEIEEARMDMPEKDFRREYLADFEAEASSGFDRDWIRYWQSEPKPDDLNVYVLVDPASKKKKDSDYTAIWCVGLGGDNSYYILDFIRDRLDLTERGDRVFTFARKYWPRGGAGVFQVRYEQYGMQADVDYLKDRMKRENFNFDLVEVGGMLAKEDRIRKLEPLFRQGRIFLPPSKYYKDHSGTVYELVSEFIETEYACFPGEPVRGHFDMLDALSRVIDSKNPPLFPRLVYSTNEHENARREAKRRRIERISRNWLAR